MACGRKKGVTVHSLKTLPPYFDAVATGLKRFELRRDDRGVQTGDVLHLVEWDGSAEAYTGRGLTAVVTYALRGPAFGLAEGWCILSLDRVEEIT